MDAPEFHTLTDTLLLLLLLVRSFILYITFHLQFLLLHTLLSLSILLHGAGWTDGEYNQDKCCHVYVRFVAPFTRMICGLWATAGW